MITFGNWINEIEKYNNNYISSKPYEHIVIPGFFDKETAERIYDSFPIPTTSIQLDWKHYDNPIEQKYTLNDFSNLPEFKEVFTILQSDFIIQKLKKITGIHNLESDPLLHGAGLHAYPRNGKLDVHLDYNIHPFTRKERRVNLIIYMNKNWKNDYGGHLQIWDSDLKDNKEMITPGFNTAVLFRTNEISYHGIPYPINCPENQYRKSVAIYYVSDPSEQSLKNPRYKAEFFPLPDQEVNPKLKKLYEIRKNRILKAEDFKDWENWRNEGYGHW